ncbi:hypothetical protein ACOSQ3_014580 [Xanthoceras sorbifolium]
MSCITGAQYKVILNGETSDSFQPGCGLRQGDPISPYIFVLCMEKLSHIIKSSLDAKRWKPIKASRGGPDISRLFFADDLILFSQASLQQASTMRRCIDEFYSCSGQQVSYPKSRVFISKNTNKILARKVVTPPDPNRLNRMRERYYILKSNFYFYITII